MNKLIGFLITKELKKIDVDFFDAGIKACKIKRSDYNIYLWGFGDIENYNLNDKYSLSFPITDTLLDRNILISFEGNKIVIENDWLGSIPVFYNEKENIISTLSNLCLKDKTIDDEGLSNFCEFGYSVFEKTMFRDVKFMRYYSMLIISDGIEVEYKKDPVLDECFLEKTSNEDETIALIQDYLSDIETKTNGDILLPTSGGYDSRILNYFITNKERIRSFTYGISKDQSKSDEVVHAKKISEIYNTKWEQIELQEFHKYTSEWIEIFGFSTHLHGMYHIEFYKKILKKHNFSNSSFLSGIIGDAWAEFGKFEDIEGYQDIINLGYTHGLNLSLKHLNFKSTNEGREKYFKQNIKNLQNEKIRVVFAMRIKLMLLSYLTQLPEYFGMPVWTPFLNFNIVKSILNIPDSKRKKRVWQTNFFKKVGLNLEDMNLKSVKNNSLDYEIGIHADFEVIDVDLMKEYIDENRMNEINKLLSNTTLFEKIKNQLLYIRKVGGALRLLGFKNNFLNALHEYYVIKAIENGLKNEP